MLINCQKNCCDNVWKSIIVALERPWKLREFFFLGLLCCHPGLGCYHSRPPSPFYYYYLTRKHFISILRRLKGTNRPLRSVCISVQNVESVQYCWHDTICLFFSFTETYYTSELHWVISCSGSLVTKTGTNVIRFMKTETTFFVPYLYALYNEQLTSKVLRYSTC